MLFAEHATLEFNDLRSYRLSLRVIALTPVQPSQGIHAFQCVRVLVAIDTTPAVQCPAIQRLGLGMLPFHQVDAAQRAHDGQRLWMLLAEYATARLQRFREQSVGLIEFGGV